MGGFTMNASTFLNAMQEDYDEFRRETLEVIAYVRKNQPAKRAEATRHVPAH
jgi:alkyl hydroperoxide reductase subunit AhpC